MITIRTLIAPLVLASAAMSLIACGGGEEKPKADPATVKAAKEIWDTRCTSCHGANGGGDGPGAGALNPKPRSFKDKKWQAATDDAAIKKVIVEGGKAVGLSESMPGNPDLKDKGPVVDQLVAMIRGMK
jgi:mono/diheme cytochrome c family protein